MDTRKAIAAGAGGLLLLGGGIGAAVALTNGGGSSSPSSFSAAALSPPSSVCATASTPDAVASTPDAVASTPDAVASTPDLALTVPGQTTTAQSHTVAVDSSDVATITGETLTLPGATTTELGQTVTSPGQTVTSPGQTVTAPGQTTTNCVQVPTVTETTTTTTTTAPTTTTTTTTAPTTTTTPTTTTVAGGTTGNVWVSTTGNDVTCTRSAALVSDPGGGGDCLSFGRAYQLAAAGDVVRVNCGAFGKQIFGTKTIAGPAVVFQPTTPLCATIQSATAGTSVILQLGTKWITIDGFNINGYQTPGGTGYTPIADAASCCTNHITISNNQIDVGKLNGGGSLISLHIPQDWTISGNTFGPVCCGNSVPASPVGITVGKPSAGTNDCTHEACNIKITRNLFQYADLRKATNWPTSGWGAAPEPTCTNTSLCHLDGVHIGGCITCQVTFNRFYGTDCEGIYIEGGGYNGNDDRDITIVGNTSTTFSDHCNGMIYVKCSGVGTCGGTWNIGFNESPDLITLGTGWSGAEPGTVVNIYGNYATLLMASATGNNAGCLAGTTGNVTIAYQYNVWRTGYGGSTQGPCNSTDTTGNTPAWVNSAGSPAVGLNMHKTGPHGGADNFVPCSSLTVGPGCPNTSDVFGTPFRATANAGADQSVRP